MQYSKEKSVNVSVFHITLSRCWAGTFKSKKEAADNMSLLDTIETDNVLTFLVEMADRGFPLTHDMLCDLVISMLHARAASTPRNHPTTSAGGDDADADDELLLEKNWTYWFIKKHSDCVKVYLSSPLDSKCGWAVNLNTNAAWFELLGESIQKHSIDKDCLYGCDETGFQIGMLQWQYVIGGAGKK